MAIIDGITLDDFRAALCGTYQNVLACDSRRGDRIMLTSYLKIEGEGGSWTTFFRVTAPQIILETQSLAEAARRYWEAVYGNH